MAYCSSGGFKPYYKWITFNTNKNNYKENFKYDSFKPYYKWITFNTTSAPGKRCNVAKF